LYHFFYISLKHNIVLNAELFCCIGIIIIKHNLRHAVEGLKDTLLDIALQNKTLRFPIALQNKTLRFPIALQNKTLRFPIALQNKT